MDTDNKLMPSADALRLHWMKCVWVLGMWHCATQNSIELPGEYAHLDIIYITIKGM